jgi:hypothetical protein
MAAAKAGQMDVADDGEDAVHTTIVVTVVPKWCRTVALVGCVIFVLVVGWLGVGFYFSGRIAAVKTTLTASIAGVKAGLTNLNASLKNLDRKVAETGEQVAAINATLTTSIAGLKAELTNYKADILLEFRNLGLVLNATARSLITTAFAALNEKVLGVKQQLDNAILWLSNSTSFTMQKASPTTWLSLSFNTVVAVQNPWMGSIELLVNGQVCSSGAVEYHPPFGSWSEHHFGEWYVYIVHMERLCEAPAAGAVSVEARVSGLAIRSAVFTAQEIAAPRLAPGM